MQETNKRSFYEPDKCSFKMLHDIVSAPSSMSVCHCHNNYELYYLKSGKRYYFIKDKTYIIDSGTFVFIRKFDIHSTAKYENESYERILIKFDEDFIQPLLCAVGKCDLLERLSGPAAIIRLPESDRSACESLLASMEKEYESSSSEPTAYLKSILLSLLILVGAQENSTPEPVQNKMISDIVGYINNNYSDEITLELISEKFYISKYYFSRSFKQATGSGYKEYLNNVRVKEAKKLLASTELTITEISSRVGYKSLPNFDRIFYKITGRTPIEYRIGSRSKLR